MWKSNLKQADISRGFKYLFIILVVAGFILFAPLIRRKVLPNFFMSEVNSIDSLSKYNAQLKLTLEKEQEILLELTKQLQQSDSALSELRKRTKEFLSSIPEEPKIEIEELKGYKGDTILLRRLNEAL